MPDRRRCGRARRAHAALALACLAAAAGGIAVPALASGPPVLSIDDARIKEGDSGVRSLVFAVRLSAPVAESVSVDVSTHDGTATVDDHDYEPAHYRLTFPPDSTAEFFSVSVIGDTKLETNEWFGVRLSDPVGAALGDSEAVGTIINDERAVFTHQWLGSTV